jgi:hypothetical protein
MDISEGMSCPVDSLRTFLKLSRPPTDTERDKQSANAYPFTISFGPSTVVPTFHKNMITDTQNDTLLYRGNRYQLSNLQFCQPTHTGYVPPVKTLVAEIVLTYINFTITDTYPCVILAIIPIYEGAVPDHSTYLQQFIDSNSQAASAQTLFYDNDKDLTATSYSYKCCFQTQFKDDPTKTIVFNTGVYYFPRGTTLVSQNIQAFKSVIANANPNQPNSGIVPFEFLPYQRGNTNTYLAANRWDPNGALPTQQVSPTDDTFMKRVQYMTQPPFRSGNVQDTCPYKKVSDYKCYPFSELNNVTKDGSGNQVVVPLGDAMTDSNKTTASGSTDWFYLLVYIIIPTLLLVGLVVLIGVSLLVTNQITNPGFEPGKGAAGAAGAAGATGAAPGSVNAKMMAATAAAATPTAPP